MMWFRNIPSQSELVMSIVNMPKSYSRHNSGIFLNFLLLTYAQILSLLRNWGDPSEFGWIFWCFHVWGERNSKCRSNK